MGQIKQIINLTALLLLVGLLESCGSQPVAPPGQTITEPEQDVRDAGYFLQLASQSTDRNEQAEYFLLGLQSLYAEGKLDRLFTLFRDFNTNYAQAEDIEPDVKVQGAILESKLQADLGQYLQALESLTRPTLAARLNEIPGELHINWAIQLGDLSTQTGRFEDAVKAYDRALALFEKAPPSTNQNMDKLERVRTGLWQALLSIAEPGNPIYLARETAGWATLSRIALENKGGASGQYAAYQRWQGQHIDHPASLTPPDSFRLLGDIIARGRPKVAIVLPLSGQLAPAGRMILDGYLAARTHEQTTHPGSTSVDLSPEKIDLYDTAVRSISSILREISSKDYDLIIGPLDKERVARFAILAPEIPTLVLNSLPEGSGAELPLIGLALDVEDEAAQAASRALTAGHHRAMLLVPESDWGVRAGKAFADQWLQDNGEVVAIEEYGDSTTHARLLEQRLQVDQSKTRKRELQRLLGKSIEFTPRRREDVDAIFLAGSPNDARQLKPMLAFFFAEDIPVFSTSSIYSGQVDPKADRDLDGIEFNTPSWVLDGNSAIKAELNKGSAVSTSQLKLNALGVDSYYISQRLLQFLGAPDTVYRGALGTVGLSTDGQNLNRKQDWARFSGGRVKPLQK